MASRLPEIGPARARLVIAIGRLVSCTLLALGILGMLRTGGSGFGGDETEQLWLFTVHPLTALIWTVLGVVGVLMAARPATARAYLFGTGILLVAWGLLGLILDGSASQVFARDVPLVVLHLVGGAISLAAVLAPLPAGDRAAEGAEPEVGEAQAVTEVSEP